ncbi:hypothetical protein TNCV_814421 [Trichonephila clavipes]|nr:hypothetical protein TNCV_814421 [Trichonephila clavipes]
MLSLSDFQRGQIVGARAAGGSMTEKSLPLGVSHGKLHKVSTLRSREAQPRKIVGGKRDSVKKPDGY